MANPDQKTILLITNFPVGFTKNLILSENKYLKSGYLFKNLGISMYFISFLILSSITSSESKSSCCVEITIVSILRGFLLLSYSIVTCDFESGLK